MNNLIFETRYWEILLADKQYYLGRCYIRLKRECGDLAELTDAEMIDFLEVIRKLEKSIRNSFGATMFNLNCAMNNAYKKDNPKPQVHFHFRPRYKNKVEFAGQVFEDREFGSRHDPVKEEAEEISESVMLEIIDKIQENCLLFY
jgi:diadenosine tetraphosphate (Ap4A) HIT family hydrolase